MTKTEMLKKARGDDPVYSVNILDLNIGDKVKIVDKWRIPNGFQSHNGYMDRYLGKTMTVSDFRVSFSGHPYVKLEEDGKTWSWSSELIDYVVREDKDIPIRDILSIIEF